MKTYKVHKSDYKNFSVIQDIIIIGQRAKEIQKVEIFNNFFEITSTSAMYNIFQQLINN